VSGTGRVRKPRFIRTPALLVELGILRLRLGRRAVDKSIHDGASAKQVVDRADARRLRSQRGVGVLQVGPRSRYLGAALVGKDQDQQQATLFAEGSEHCERLAFEGMMWARDDDAFRKVVVVGSMWRFPWTSIPHPQLMACLEVRIADRSVLRLIRMWLQAPPEGTAGAAGETRRTAESEPERKGTPQGGVASPLLANLYLHWFDRAFQRGPARWTGAKLVRYADDFLVLTRQWDQRLQNWIENRLEGKFQLTINREKTKLVDLREEKAKVNFLASDAVSAGSSFPKIGPSFSGSRNKA